MDLYFDTSEIARASIIVSSAAANLHLGGRTSKFRARYLHLFRIRSGVAVGLWIP